MSKFFASFLPKELRGWKLMVFILPFILSLVYVILFSVDVPLIHDWIVLKEIFLSDNLIYDFWRPTNGHRNFTAKTLFYIAFHLTQLDFRVLIILNLLIVWLSALIIIGLIQKIYNFSYKLYIPLVFIILSLSQYGNLLYAWQLSLNLSILSALLTFYFLSKDSWKAFFLTIVFALISLSSFGNGLLVFPVGMLYLVIKKGHWPKVIIWLIFFVASWIFYFTNYTTGSEESLILKLPSIITMFINLTSTGALIGVGKVGSFYWLTGLYGFLLTIVMLSVIIWNLRRFFSRQLNLIQLIFIYFTLVLLQIAIGRSNSEFGLASAFATQYTTFSLFFCTALFALLHAMSKELTVKYGRTILLRILGIFITLNILFILGTGNLFGLIMGPQIFGFNYQKQHLVKNYQYYPQEYIWANLGVAKSDSLRVIRLLNENKKSVFADKKNNLNLLIIDNKIPFRNKTTEIQGSQECPDGSRILKFNQVKEIKNIIIRLDFHDYSKETQISLLAKNMDGTILLKKVFLSTDLHYRGYLELDQADFQKISATLEKDPLTLELTYDPEIVVFSSRNVFMGPFINSINSDCIPEVEINIGWRYRYFLILNNFRRNIKRLI